MSTPPGASDGHLQILRDYEILEPGDADTWNPLTNDGELAYRLALFQHLTVALRRSGASPDSLKVLDIGCGNARSTRAYLDLGLLPDQLTGVDIRPGAILRAERLHGQIQFATGVPPDQTWNWVAMTTVFSSVADPQERQTLAQEAGLRLAPGGHLFYFDLTRANDFAGGDLIGPRDLFGFMDLVWGRQINRDNYRTNFDANYWTLRKRVRWAKRRLFPKPTHECWLFRLK